MRRYNAVMEEFFGDGLNHLPNWTDTANGKAIGDTENIASLRLLAAKQTIAEINWTDERDQVSRPSIIFLALFSLCNATLHRECTRLSQPHF